MVKEIRGLRVHRTGSALHLCPFAYITGIEAMQNAASAAAHVRADLDIKPFIGSLEALRRRWPEHLEALNKIDRKIWPKEPPSYPTAVLAVTRLGQRRWYWYDPATQVLIEAETPALTEDQKERLDRAVSEMLECPDQFFINGRHLATFCLTEE